MAKWFTDINECSDDTTLCSNDNQRCVNMPGTYRCDCRNGYHSVNGVCEGEYTSVTLVCGHTHSNMYVSTYLCGVIAYNP